MDSHQLAVSRHRFERSDDSFDRQITAIWMEQLAIVAMKREVECEVDDIANALCLPTWFVEHRLKVIAGQFAEIRIEAEAVQRGAVHDGRQLMDVAAEECGLTVVQSPVMTEAAASSTATNRPRLTTPEYALKTPGLYETGKRLAGAAA